MAVVVAGAILSLQLLVPPVVGLADNGDFEKVMAPVGLAYPTASYGERHWSWALTRFSVVAPRPSNSGALYSEILVAGMAARLSRWLRPEGARVFDIRTLGAVHIVVLLGAIALILAACRDLAPVTQVAVAVLLVFFFTDVGYAACFNSLYGQTASFLFLFYLVGIAGLAVRRGGLSWPLLGGYVLCAVLFLASKPQECIHGPVLALLGVALAGPRKGWVAAGLGVALIAFSAWYYYDAIPELEIRKVARYHTVFMELLPNSPQPARDLAELGLDADLIRYSGIHAYLPTSPIGDPGFQARFFERFGYRKLLVFYATHPSRLFDRTRRAARRAFRLRPASLGNFAEDAGRPAGEQTRRFAAWSDLRLRLGRRGLLWLGLALGGTALFVGHGFGRASPRGRSFRTALGALVIMATVEFFVCALADFLGDLPRHLYAFQAMFDLILIADAGWLVQSFVSWSRRRALSLAPGSA